MRDTMLGKRNGTTMAVASALSTIALLSALAAPSLAMATTTAPTLPAEAPTQALAEAVEALAEDAPVDHAGGDGQAQLCVRISTDPLYVGVHEDCGSGGVAEIDGRSVP